MKILLIGKNSAIVKVIESELENYEFVSHNDLSLLNLNSYDVIFLFSWDHATLEGNLKILSLLDLSKVVFISSIAVLACARRPQWAQYPNWKLICENLVLKAGGKIIRIGIWDQNFIKSFSGLVPVTTTTALVNAMNECLTSEVPVAWPITIKSGRLSGIKRRLTTLINKISLLLPPVKTFQAPLALILRAIGSREYSYTHDAFEFFSHRVLVGYGAVGSVVSNELNKRNLNHSIVVSNEKDLFLNSDGFRGLRIGQYKEGLSKLWHGAWISRQESDKPLKKVPIFVMRPRVPISAIYGRVIQLNLQLPFSSVQLDHPYIADVRVFAENIHLAAGVINNVKILQTTHQISTYFSDHEIGEVGFVSSRELVEKGLVRRRLGFVFGRFIQKGRCDDSEYIIDFRPRSRRDINFEAENIYNNRTHQIFLKLIRNMSFGLFNQAIFNKFGFALDLGEFSIIVQIDAHDCINLDKDGGLSRNRLSDRLLVKIVDQIALDYQTLRKEPYIRTVDAIHVYGGFDLADFPDLQNFIADKRLFMHGNVFDGSRLGPFHNTVSMMKRSLESIKDV